MRTEDVDLVEFLQRSGYSRVAEVVNKILTTAQFHRLKSISYLGSFPFVFGGAEFTRWEHSINTAKLAAVILSANHIPEIDAEKLILWGLLHDIGHIFFSHIGEAALSNRNFDHRYRLIELLEEEELEIILRKGGIHLTEFPANGLFLMQSHVDCDSLDGISQTAKILGLDSMPWEPLLAEVVHFKGGEWSWDASALPTIREFWRLKGQIYREYVYSPKNQACEAWLEEIIRQLDPDSKDLELGDKALLVKACRDPRVAPMLDQLQAGLQYQEVILETISARFENDGGFSCWQSVLKELLENIFHWDAREFLVKVTRKKTFRPWELGDLPRDPIPWKDLEGFLDQYYDIKTVVIVYLSPRLVSAMTLRDLTALRNLDIPTSTFHGINVLKSDAEVITEIEGIRGYELEAIPTDLPPEFYSSLGNNYRVVNYRVKELHVNSSQKDLPASMGNLSDLEHLSVGLIHHVPSTVGSLSRLKTLVINSDVLSSLPPEIGNLRNLEILDIRAPNLDSLPDILGKLTSLKRLILEECKLSQLPPSFGDLANLEELNLRGNDFHALPDAFTRLRKLRVLKLSENPLTTLPKSLGHLGKLRELTLDMRKLQQVPPQLLLSRIAELQHCFRYYFYLFAGNVTNLPDYVTAYAHGEDSLEPILLQFGSRIIPLLEAYNSNEGPPGGIQRCGKLALRIKTRQQQARIKIQFLNLEASSGSRAYPMGVLFISAHLKAHDFPSVQYRDFFYPPSLGNDPFEDEHFKTFLADLIAFNPHFLFIGPITTPQIRALTIYAPPLKKTFPATFIIAGGPHFGKDGQLDDELFQQCPEIDAVIQGEAEETVTRVVSCYYDRELGGNLDRKKMLLAFGEIPGVKIQGNLVRDPPAIDLSMSAPPDLDLLTEYLSKHPVPYTLASRRDPYMFEWPQQGNVPRFYLGPPRYFDRLTGGHIRVEGQVPYGIIVGSRGCPYRCAFCCSSSDRKIYPAQFIFNCMKEYFDRFYVRLFNFSDPLFTTAHPVELERVRQLCTLLLEVNEQFHFIVDIRADIINQLPEDLLILLIRSGCVEFNIGLEKGTDPQLQTLMKGVSVKAQGIAIQKLRETSLKAGRDVLINGTFILGGSGETRADILQTLVAGFTFDLDGLVFFPLEIHPGTEIYTHAVKEGIISRGLEPYLQKNYPIYISPGLTAGYLNRIKDLAQEAVLYHEQIERLDPQLSRGEILPILHEIRSDFLPQILSEMNPRNAGKKVLSRIQSVKEASESGFLPVLRLLEKFLGAMVRLFEYVIS